MKITPSKIKKGIVAFLTLISLGIFLLAIYSFTQGTETGMGMLCCFGPVMLIILVISAWLMSSANKDELVESQLDKVRKK